MHENFCNLLNAYMDGELHGARLQEMELHISTCSKCRQDLKELQSLSTLLKADPAPEFMPAERFISNLGLTLPRREIRERQTRSTSFIWWLIPAGLMMAWFFVRTVFSIASAISIANEAGFLGQASSWFGNEQATFWYSAITGLFSGYPSADQTLSLLNNLNLVGTDLFTGLAIQLGIVFLYWFWLSTWWFRRRSETVKSPASSVNS